MLSMMLSIKESMPRKKYKNNLDEWGYPIHPEMNYLKPQGDFETRIALVIAFSLIILGIVYSKEFVWLML